MSKKAIFTCVFKEDFFLPLWFEYYSRYFDTKDIYVLEHLLPGEKSKRNWKQIVHSVVLDGVWMCEQVCKQQKELLKRYDTVVYTDVDEFLVHKTQPLDVYLDSIESDGVSATGYEVYHRPEIEPDLDLSRKPLLAQRNWWYATKSYDKPCVARIPVPYTVGYHEINPDCIRDLPEHKGLAGRPWVSNPEGCKFFRDNNLAMVHLKRVDYKRFIEKVKEWDKYSMNEHFVRMRRNDPHAYYTRGELIFDKALVDVLEPIPDWAKVI